MLEFIEGEVAHIAENYVVLQTGGIGYKIFATVRFLTMAQKGRRERLYTHMSISDTEISLYGFENLKEKAMFQRLLGVSGVGSKSALAVLSSMTIGEITKAALAQDTKAFTRAPGIGPKAAGRIVLELKDKVDAADAAGAVFMDQSSGNEASDAIEALIALGYDKSDAVSAVSAVGELADSAEELTRLALKSLAKQ